MSSNRSVREKGDPFAYAGSRREQDRPHGCIDGVVYVGHMVEDPETGGDLEVIEPVPCRRCAKEISSATDAGFNPLEPRS